MNCFFESCLGAINNANENKSFGIYYSEAQNPNPDMHIHDCCEIFFCLSGGKNFLIGNKLYDVNDNDIFVLNQYEAHKVTFDPARDFRRYVFQVSPDFMRNMSSNVTDLSACFYPHRSDFDHRVHLSYEQAQTIKASISLLANNESFGDDIIKNSAMSTILVELNRMYLDKDQNHFPSHQNKTVKAAIDYINSHFSEEITLETVAKAVYLSVNQLCRLFSEHCGTTVAKYITSRRITEAKKLLSEGRSVTETAMLCGFGDHTVFIRAFKKNVGVTPGRYGK